MPLFYQLLFPGPAPAAEAALRQQAAAPGRGYVVQPEAVARWAVLHEGQLVLQLAEATASSCLELPLGPYPYQTEWYLTLGKTVGLRAMHLLLALLGQVITEAPVDFLSVGNGERVLAERLGGRLLLNAASSTWQQPDNLALLCGCAYELITYPLT